MGAPANEALRELERELVIAAEQGEQRSVAALRDAVALGHDDLMSGLDVLRGHGKAVEVAPGEWRGPMADELPAPDADPDREAELNADGRVRVREHVEGEGEPEAEQERRGGPTIGSMLAGYATVRLTPAVVEALDAEALGKLVKAAIGEAQERDEPFTLEVGW